jgi:anti-anti-sigma factor
MKLDIQITEVGAGGRRIALRGRLDTESAPALDECLERLLASPAVTAALFDLASLEYIGSAGIRVLIKTRKALEARGGGMAVANLQPTVRQVFEIVKALPSTDIFATDAELDAYLDKMRRRSPAARRRAQDRRRGGGRGTSSAPEDASVRPALVGVRPRAGAVAVAVVAPAPRRRA